MGQEIVAGTVLSSSLKSALQRIEREPQGTQFSISSKTKSEAVEAAAALDEAMKPAPDEAAERWLEALGVLTATNPDDRDARLKIHAMSRMLTFPARCYNRSSLDAAARKFRFFPSYAEITAHLEGEAAEAKTLRHQLRRLIALPVQDDRAPRGKWSEMTDEQRAEFERLMAGFRGNREQESAKAENLAEG